MAAKKTDSAKAKYARECKNSREKNGIPESIAQGKSLPEDFIEAIEVMAEATDFAISKALRRQWNQRLYGNRGSISKDKKIVLSAQDVNVITNNAMRFIPDSIRSSAAHLGGDDLEDVEYNPVYSRTMEIFNAYSPEGLRTRVAKRMPGLLSSYCEMPEFEPEA